MARQLKVEIIGDASSLNRALGSATKSSSGASRAFAGLARAGVLVGAALGAAAAVGIKKSIDAASNLAEQVNKANVVFRGSEKQVLEWSKGLESSFGLSQRAALEAAGTFGNMLVPMGFARKEAALMSEEMVQLAGDMASFNNASPEDTLLAIRSGLAGEAEPLRKYGVFLSEARVQQEALIETGKKNVKELTAQEKATARYNLILKDTKDTQGDFARSAGESMANQMRILRASLEDVSAGLGQIFLPIVIKVFGFINKSVVPALQSAVDWTKNFFAEFDKAKGVKGKLSVASDAFKQLASSIATSIKRALFGFDKLMGGGKSGRFKVSVPGLDDKFAAAFAELDWNKVGDEIINGIANAVKGGSEVAKKLGGTITAALRTVNWAAVGEAAGPGLVTAMLAAFQAILDPVFWIQNWELAIGVAINALALLFPELFAAKLIAPLRLVGERLVLAVASGLEKISPTLARAFLAMMMKLPPLLKAPFAALESAVRSFFGKLGGLAVFTLRVLGIAAAVSAIASFVRGAIDTFGRLVSALYDKGFAMAKAVADGIGAGARWIIEQLKKIPGYVADAAKSAVTAAYRVGENIVHGLVDGMIAVGSGAIQAAASWLASLIPGWMKKFLGISSPSKVMAEEVGRPISEGVAAGITAAAPAAAKAAAEAAKKAVAAAKQAVADARGSFASAFGDLASVAMQAFDEKMSQWKSKSQIKLDKMQLQDQIASEKQAISDAQTELNAAREAVRQEATAENIKREQDAIAAVAAAKRSQQEAELGRDAAREQAAHDKQVARDKIRFQDRLDKLKAELAAFTKSGGELTAAESRKFRAGLNDLLKDYGIDARFWGTAIGISLANGLKEAQGAVRQAALALAKAIARLLKAKSPTEEGPMADLDTWWSDLVPTLVSGIDYGGAYEAGTFIAKSIFGGVDSEVKANGGFLAGLGPLFGELSKTTPTAPVTDSISAVSDSVTEASGVIDTFRGKIEELPSVAAEAFTALARSIVAALAKLPEILAPPTDALNLVADAVRRIGSEAYYARAALRDTVDEILGLWAKLAAQGIPIPGRATGGPVTAGRPYIVGESGPELFIPGTSGRIAANGSSSMRAGGGNVQVVVYGDVTGEEIVRKVREGLLRIDLYNPGSAIARS